MYSARLSYQRNMEEAAAMIAENAILKDDSDSESTEDLKETMKMSAYSKSLTDLVSSLTHREDDEEEEHRYGAILHTLGLSGDKEESIDLPMFRRAIMNNLNVDASFLYKRVFSALDTTRKGYLTGKELVSAIYILLYGPFQEHINLGMRVYGKPVPKNPDDDPEVDKRPSGIPVPTSAYVITRVDAINSIVESLQLSSPRARHTLTTDNREKAYHIGEDLVFIIYPKLDIDGDGVVSHEDFTKACHDDPTLVQVFGQFLPRNVHVLPSPPRTPPMEDEASALPERVASAILERPKSVNSFEGINYLKHSPTMGKMWGRAENVENRKSSDDLKKSERLEPIPVVRN